jgi:PDZ domain-containing protein
MNPLPARPRIRPFVLVVLLVAALIALLAAIPVPYYLIAPGTAVDLGKTIAVDGRPPPPERFYLTDVTLQRASVLLLPGALFPNVRLVKQETIVPRGIAPKRYDSVMTDAMGESQDIAAVVAERAAGYRVATPQTQVYVDDFVQASKAAGALKAGDQILTVAGRPVHASSEIAKIITNLPAGTRVPVVLVRGGRVLTVDAPTMATKDGTRFGILVASRYAKPHLPVPVRYSIANISGSSGGLMFALDIYRTLRPGRHLGALKIAGTGTIAYDGSVGPIEGTPQKLIAAKRAGARLFLCPKENYRDIAGERDVRIIPVGSFRDAVRALEAT